MASPLKIRNSLSSLPEQMIHREFKASDRRGNSHEPEERRPFDLAVQKFWHRDAEDKENAEKKKVKLPAINPQYPSRMPNVSTNKEFSGKNKLSFPPMPAQRKSEALNFSKLISNGYGADWFQQCTGWEKKIQETSENSEQSKDSEPSQPESALASNESKPLFQGCLDERCCFGERGVEQQRRRVSACVRAVERGTRRLAGVARCEGTPALRVKVPGGACATP
ncbi:LOW QUALITY PROTEIN: uncharacterized protein C7orf57 homolog [Gymnogyps californianus]|uniref:LOW QUALITY PROTEIN: uncharacterized protein C7orf57 homolog n=1 Tax=Gymnogyps californianus TaxID=33616 RepID=UPI0021C607A8|nr:LOW QUALITY PROTEIN: uncharacterized protein C7orf57 homolog [Gymnogyps californianus]